MGSKQVLKNVFGYDSFREGQEEVIDSLLLGKNTLGIMPTGAGKSLCFQLPALMRDGVTIVISPLVSLMQDQVRQLRALEIKGAYINSSLNSNQIKQALYNISQNHYKIIYVAPERLMHRDFNHAIKALKIDFVIVDEAHCISKWGHDFRTSYMDIPRFIKSLGNVPNLAGFTATANMRTQESIIENLNMHSPTVVKNSFDRPNLFFEVLPANKRSANLLYRLKNNDESAIVYCNTRKETEKVTKRLIKHGVLAAMYHAGLSIEERRKNQEDFTFDRIKVMVATNAFGMGINKPDVRQVIHYNMPKDIESYYQEVGRAGRDGLPATGLLFYSRSDLYMNQLIQSNNNSEANSSNQNEQVLHRAKSLERMNAYAISTNCYRNLLLGYFGEKRFAACNHCSNCKSEFETLAIDDEASIIIAYVKELKAKGRAIGKGRMLKVLVDGNQEESPIHSSLTGKLKNHSKKSVEEIMDYLVDVDYLNIDSLNYYILIEGSKSNENTKGLEMKIRKTSNKRQTVNKRNKKSSKQTKKEVHANPELYEALRLMRSELATEEKMPAYIIFNNVTLDELTDDQPQTEKELLNITGIGNVKLEKYGKIILETIKQNRVKVKKEKSSKEVSKSEDDSKVEASQNEKIPVLDQEALTKADEEIIKAAYLAGISLENISISQNKDPGQILESLQKMGFEEDYNSTEKDKIIKESTLKEIVQENHKKPSDLPSQAGAIKIREYQARVPEEIKRTKKPNLQEEKSKNSQSKEKRKPGTLRSRLIKMGILE